MSTTDKARVLARLRLGPVKPTDFLLPGVVDGARPIMRVAARIKDLRDEGYGIQTGKGPGGVALYTLTSSPDSSGNLAGAKSPGAVASGQRDGSAPATPSRLASNRRPAGNGGAGAVEVDGLTTQRPAAPGARHQDHSSCSGIAAAMELDFGPAFGAGRYYDEERNAA